MAKPRRKPAERYCRWQPGMNAIYRQRVTTSDPFMPAFVRTDVVVEAITKLKATIKFEDGKTKSVPQRVLEKRA